jgi:hypothetical protein
MRFTGCRGIDGAAVDVDNTSYTKTTWNEWLHD